MKKLLIVLAMGLLVLCTPMLSVALTIQIGSEYGGSLSQIDYYEPIGQSFLAEDSNVLIAFSIGPMNTSYNPSDPLVYSIYSGEGFGGSLLASHNIIASSSGWLDVDFSHINLTPGNTYTAGISVSGSSPYWGARTNDDVYSYGQGYTDGSAVSYIDFSLRVTPTSSNNPVPEPSTMILLGVGLVGLVGTKRRKLKK